MSIFPACMHEWTTKSVHKTFKDAVEDLTSNKLVTLFQVPIDNSKYKHTLKRKGDIILGFYFTCPYGYRSINRPSIKLKVYSERCDDLADRMFINDYHAMNREPSSLPSCTQFLGIPNKLYYPYINLIKDRCILQPIATNYHEMFCIHNIPESSPIKLYAIYGLVQYLARRDIAMSRRILQTVMTCEQIEYENTCKIQKQLRESNSNPRYKMCQNRLLNEFEVLKDE